MSSSKATNETLAPPPLQLDGRGMPEWASLADVVQWFLDYDRRVSAIKHPSVEELFQWKQEADKPKMKAVHLFGHAEDRLAVGIFQALAAHNTEAALHDWIKQLLCAIEESSKAKREISAAYNLETSAEAPAVRESAKISAQQERTIFLTSCWLETLCTAEARVLGWIYQQLYNRPFHPQNF
ncbi:MAG: hypothetical protein H0T92_16940 [Pyrinomonadaceae bacterium]|nr:hypothetical protein [Pyrinomonadaceae bacterium]